MSQHILSESYIVPIYAYKCTACGHAQDVLQKMSDKPLTECPECKQSTYAKQVTAAGFQLKGSGWYVTDFRNNAGGTSKTSEAAVAKTAADAAATAAGSSDAAASAPAASTPAAAPAAASSAGNAASTTSTSAAAPASSSTGTAA
jgi:putative FmdB family regulatory protein